MTNPPKQCPLLHTTTANTLLPRPPINTPYTPPPPPPLPDNAPLPYTTTCQPQHFPQHHDATHNLAFAKMSSSITQAFFGPIQCSISIVGRFMGLLEPSTGVLVHAFSSPPAPQLPTGVSLPLTHLFISLSTLLPAGVSLYHENAKRYGRKLLFGSHCAPAFSYSRPSSVGEALTAMSLSSLRYTLVLQQDCHFILIDHRLAWQPCVVVDLGFNQWFPQVIEAPVYTLPTFKEDARRQACHYLQQSAEQ